MKLHPKRNGSKDLPNSDKDKLHTIKARLTRVSETVRQNQLSEEKKKAETPAKPRIETVRLVPPAAKTLRVKITRKTGNLTLNSASQVSAPSPGHPAALPAPASDEVVWKGRKMHGRHLPVLQCNNCSISRVCTKFKAGYECAFLPFLNSHRVESTDDLIKYMKLMTGNAMKRAQLMSIIETANGGMPSVETSEALDMAFRQLKDLHGVMSEKNEDTIEIEGDATIVGSIFGGMKLESVIAETAAMKKADPVLALPEVPLAQDDVRALSDANVSDELIRDALLGATGNSAVRGNPKNGLQSKELGEISQSEISKT